VADRGVVLFNLGGPETLADVRPFLYNLFSDPEIIRIPNSLARKTLAWLIATLRQRKSRGLYRQIGGGSPLRRITSDQARALESRLGGLGKPVRVYVAMRCWKPTIDEATEQIRRDGIRQLVALPLFPQYSVTTTGSCFKYFRNCLERTGLASVISIDWVENWYDDPLYVDSMADLIRAESQRFAGGPSADLTILYSAHSIPSRYVDDGDPYLEQTRRSAALIDAQLGLGARSMLAFQSKVGPVRWLEPATSDVIAKLGAERCRNLLVVPISFVSDHIETLQEIDIAYRELAAKAGIREFRRTASLNLHPKFIECLQEIVRRSFARIEAVPGPGV
jgi:protoporphyrin/coproporphyrin ferrochelatase